MRRFFTIILILVVIGLVIVGVMWLSARNTATQNNAPKPTFREFISGSTSGGSGVTSPGGTLSSSFDESTTGQTQGQGQPTSPGVLTVGQTPSLDGSLDAPGTQTSTFTNDTLIPTSPTGTTSTVSNTPTNPASTQTADTTPTGTTSSPGSTTTNTPPATPTGGSASVAQCSEADTNIVFTPSELAELKTLERRFYTIAESIRTDEDIAREVTNHDTFKLKGDQILELYNYCAQKSPRLTTPSYQRRVATPFWNNQSTDKAGFITEASNREQTLTRGVPDDFIINSLKRRLEHGLRLNLW